MIDAKSGVSGAGRGGGERLHYVNVDENVSALQGRRATATCPEIAQELAGARQATAPVTFVPHLLPLDQGLLATAT